jgi:N-acetylneuraminic acid mutarotase
LVRFGKTSALRIDDTLEAIYSKVVISGRVSNHGGLMKPAALAYSLAFVFASVLVLAYASGAASAQPGLAAVEGGPGASPLECLPGGWVISTPGPSPRMRMGAATDSVYVYVYGGADYSGQLADLWRWDPVTNGWLRLADMPIAKSDIQGAYWNGKIYVPGGYIGYGSDDLSIYDVATNQWTLGAPLPNRGIPMTAAWNGKIFALGANQYFPYASEQVWIYDVATNTWTRGPDMPGPRELGRAITVGNYIYYAGGDDGGGVRGETFRYDPLAQTWTTLASLNSRRTGLELMSGDSNTIVAANGAPYWSPWEALPEAETVEIYDIAANSWYYGPPVAQPAASSAGAFAGGRYVLMGGLDHYPQFFETTQYTWCGAPTATPSPTPTLPGTITPTPTLPPACEPSAWTIGSVGPPARIGAGATSDGLSIYVYAGFSGFYPAPNRLDLWRWDPVTASWTQLADMRRGKAQIQGAYWGGRIYVPGGVLDSGCCSNDLQIYDIATNSWTYGANQVAFRSGATSAWNGKIYVQGGFESNGVSNETLIYTIATDSWAHAAQMPAARGLGRAVTVGAYIYYVGGMGSDNHAKPDLYRYDPQLNTWTTLAALNTARVDLELMSDGAYTLLAANGWPTWLNWHSLPLSQTVEIYDLRTNVWQYSTPVALPAAGSAGGYADGHYMLMGGVDYPAYHAPFDTTQFTVCAGTPVPTVVPTRTLTPSLTRTATSTRTATVTGTPPTATPSPISTLMPSGVTVRDLSAANTSDPTPALWGILGASLLALAARAAAGRQAGKGRLDIKRRGKLNRIVGP